MGIIPTHIQFQLFTIVLSIMDRRYYLKIKKGTEDLIFIYF